MHRQMGAKGKAAKGAAGKKKASEASDAPADTKPKGKKKGGGKKACTWGQDDLEAELACVGLRVKQVTGDGNCFFRTLSDQLEGCERRHAELRQQTVDFMQQHPDDYAPFTEDDETFDKYLSRIRKDACWAGHMEMVAASRMLQCNLHIYQAGQPRWVIECGAGPSARTLHLAYHDGLHYNSVRNADDHSVGAPPEPIVLRAPSAEAVAAAAAAAASASQKGPWGAKEEQRVCSSTGCSDRALVRQALEGAHGDVDAAIERVIEVLSNRLAAEDEEQAEAEAETEAETGTAGGEGAGGAGGEAASGGSGGDQKEQERQAHQGAAEQEGQQQRRQQQQQRQGQQGQQQQQQAHDQQQEQQGPGQEQGAGQSHREQQQKADTRRQQQQQQEEQQQLDQRQQQQLSETTALGEGTCKGAERADLAHEQGQCTCGSRVDLGGERGGAVERAELCRCGGHGGEGRDGVRGGQAGDGAARHQRCGADGPIATVAGELTAGSRAGCQEVADGATDVMTAGGGDVAVGRASKAEGSVDRRPGSMEASDGGSGSDSDEEGRGVGAAGGAEAGAGSEQATEGAAAAVGAKPATAAAAAKAKVAKAAAKGTRVDNKKPSRNKACPCGSKKKYKTCCGAAAAAATRRQAAAAAITAGAGMAGKGGAKAAASESALPSATALAAASKQTAALYI